MSDIVVGTKVSDYRNTLLKVQAELDKSGEKDERGAQTFDLRTGVHVLTAIEAPCLDLWAKHSICRSAVFLAPVSNVILSASLGYLFFVGDRKKTDLPYQSEEDSDCEWYRLRNEEAIDAEHVVALCKAAKDKYGFKDFKLKGGVLRGDEEMKVIKAMKKAFPDARMDLDPNGAWHLDDAVRYVADMHGILTYCEDPAEPKTVIPAAKS